MVGSMVNSSLHCQTEVRGDLPRCSMVPTSAAAGEGQWGPFWHHRERTRQQPRQGREQEQNLLDLLSEVGINLSSNPNSTIKCLYIPVQHECKIVFLFCFVF